MRKAIQIEQILFVDGLIEIVSRRDIAFDLWRQMTLGIERSARSQPHHEEGERDDDEERGQGAEKTPNGISEHLLSRESRACPQQRGRLCEFRRPCQCGASAMSFVFPVWDRRSV